MRIGGRAGAAKVGAVLLIVVALAAGCGGGDDDESTGSGDTVGTATSEAPGNDGSSPGVTVNAGTLLAPPPASGDSITAEQADAVSRTVVLAWMDGDRATAEQFAAEPSALEDLFSRAAPSSEFAGGDATGYCGLDGDSGSYQGCSYSVVDDSPDGALALSTELAIVDGRVRVTAAGFADWND